MRRTQAISVIVVIAVAVAAVAIALTSNPSSGPKDEFLTNGEFETSDLRGWNTGKTLVPTVESTMVNNGTYAARFETTSNGNVLAECTQQALDCAAVNSSTISQDISGFSLSPNSSLSIALYPAFQYPSIFQVTLDFAPSSPGSPDITVYYVFSASPAQCDAYAQLLVNASATSRTLCLTLQQGTWNVVTRAISGDLPSSVTPSGLGSSLTLSLSFAGGNSTDLIYVDSVSLRR